MPILQSKQQRGGGLSGSVSFLVFGVLFMEGADGAKGRRGGEGSAARVREWTAETGNHKPRVKLPAKRNDSLVALAKGEEDKTLFGSRIEVVADENREGLSNGNRKDTGAGGNSLEHEHKVAMAEGGSKRDSRERASKTESKVVSAGFSKRSKDEVRDWDRVSKKDRGDSKHKVKDKPAAAADNHRVKDKVAEVKEPREHRPPRSTVERVERSEKRKRSPEPEWRSKGESRNETKSKEKHRDVKRDEKNGKFDRWELKSDETLTKGRKESLLADERKSLSKSNRQQSSPTNERGTKQRGRSRSASPKPKKSRSSHSSKEYEKSSSSHHMDRSGKEKGEKEKDQERSSKEKDPDRAATHENRYRGFGGRGSGLGGYSPRRRRSDAAIKTPSPPPRSPDKDRKKSRAWDLPPQGIDSNMVAALAAAHHAAAQQAAVLASVTGLAGGSGSTSAGQMSAVSAIPALVSSVLQHVNPAVTAVSLTQASRPLRRLYIGNVPSSVSEGELLEFMNTAMLSANANHLPGTKPCISCSVQVDKGYAYAEFLTPEDATAAIAFDGIALHGTTLKIRRPKDFVHSISGGLEISPPAIDMVSNLVVDSPSKVFVGGISSSLSSDKVKEIVTAFGQLKAFHWESDKSRNPPEAFAFLEYLDPSVTLKACAGLNGMRLGNGILTAVQATPNALSEEGAGVPFYGVPEHAKTLLAAPTRILEVQHVVTEEELSTLQQEALDEIIEDVRLECSRFGKVKSLYLLKSVNGQKVIAFSWVEPTKLLYGGELLPKSVEPVQHIYNDDSSLNRMESPPPVGVFSQSQVPSSLYESPYVHQPLDSSRSSLSLLITSSLQTLAERTSDPEESIPLSNSHSLSSEINDAHRALEGSKVKIEIEELNITDMSEGPNQLGDSNVQLDGTNEPNITEARMPNMIANSSGGTAPLTEPLSSSTEEVVDRHIPARTVKQEKFSGDFRSLCPGRIYVEYPREISACQAAHALHGRAYGDRKVFVNFFPPEIYHRRTWKKAAS